MDLLKKIVAILLVLSAGCGDPQEPDELIVDPILPFQLTAELDAEGIRLKWDTSVTPDATYSIQRKVETNPLTKVASLAVGDGEWFDSDVTDYLTYQYRVSAKIGTRAVGTSNSEFIQYFSFPVTQSHDYTVEPDTYLRNPQDKLVFVNPPSDDPFYLPVTSNQSRVHFFCTAYSINNTYKDCPSQMLFDKVDVLFDLNPEGYFTYYVKAQNPDELEDSSPLAVTFLADFNPPSINGGNLYYTAAIDSDPAFLSFLGNVEDAGSSITLFFSGDTTPATFPLESRSLDAVVTWKAPDRMGQTSINLKVSDEAGHTATVDCTIDIGSQSKGSDCF